MITDAFAAINTSITLVSRLREISSHINEAEFKNLLADLSIQLADAKLQIAGLKEQLADQVDEIRALKRAAPEGKEKPSGTKWGCYQFKDDDGLYCTACYDTKGAKSRTNRVNSMMRMCPVCQATLFSG